MKNKNMISRKFAYILHRIFNERHSNWALLAEMLIVSSVVWYLVDCTYTIVARANEPTGFDATNCYRLTLAHITSDAPDYDAARPSDSIDINVEDKLRLLERIRHDEDIELAAYSMRNAPYDGGMVNCGLRYDTLETNVTNIACQPDFIRIFRYWGINGETPAQLAAQLKDNNIFISEGAFKGKTDERLLINKDVSLRSDTNQTHRVAAVIHPIKRFTWEELSQTREIVYLIDNDILYGEGFGVNLSVRVKENRTDGFKERFKEKIKGKKMREGNIYVSDVASYDDLKEASNAGQYYTVRFYTVALVFLMANVFLGLLGTFWFRTQHRYPEIGLQKAVGATNADITLRLFAEAVLLMTAAFVPSLIIDLNIAHADLTEHYKGLAYETPRFIVCAAISYVLMLIIISLGIWFPAKKAVKANPADVLRGE